MERTTDRVLPEERCVQCDAGTDECGNAEGDAKRNEGREEVEDWTGKESGEMVGIGPVMLNLIKAQIF